MSDLKRIQLPVGVSSFEKIRMNNNYYVDKTGLIREVVSDTSDVILITRPRRFGKTLGMNMLESFFNIEKDTRELFDELEISQDTDICDKWMNRYPTVFMTFKEIDGLNFASAYARMRNKISEIFNRFEYLMESDRISQDEKKIFVQIKRGEESEDWLKDSLTFLTKLLRRHYGSPVVVLLDEYDVPLAKATDNGYYKEMLDLMKGLLQVFKDNNDLAFAVITGCLRIAKESIFTGTNNFKINTISSKRFNEYFGFTEAEVKKILSDANASEQYEKVKEWYDGYNFGGRDIYCPWDVVNYVDDFIYEGRTQPMCYWNNTSGNTIIRMFIDKFSDEIREDFEDLLANRVIRKTIKEDLTYDLLHSSEENFWSILYLTGYLTMAKENNDNFPEREILLKIPNKEVEQIFNDSIREWFKDTVHVLERDDLFKAVWNGNAEEMTKQITRLLAITISYYDYREDFYHAFLAGIFTGAGYRVESNREHGEGRSDIVVKDRKNMRVAIFEIKYAKKKQDLEKACDEAIIQMKKRQYNVDYEDDYDEILCYGIAFYKKRCFVH